MTKDVQRLLSRLGYDARWIQLGLIDMDMLFAQAKAIDEVDADHNTEHYRNAALRTFLDRRVTTPEQLRGLMALALIDPDPAFGEHILHQLLALTWIDDAHFEEVARFCDGQGLGTVSERARLKRRAQRSLLDNGLLADCLASNDARVQEALLERPDLRQEDLARLAANGASRSIRNSAADRGRRRK